VIALLFTTGTAAIVAAAMVSLVQHFLVGARSLVRPRSWWSARLEMTLPGVIGGGATFLVGFAPPT
jgi:vacuolar iron transporter family protein